MKALRSDPLQAADGEIGTVDAVVFETRRWGVRYLVLDTGTWLSSRKVLLDTGLLEDGKPLRARLTREEIRRAPQYDEGDDALPPLHSSAALIGCALETPEGSLGHVEDLLVDGEAWAIADLVVDTRSWPSLGWLGGMRVLIAPAAVAGLDLGHRRLRVRLPRDEILRAPPAAL